MRADRLLALLLLLQTRGQMTARMLASELEVSERTIYRDVDALCAAGVPIYSETGQDGGYGLIDSYRTSLTGLTTEEVRALFMLNIPAPLTALGVTQAMKTALLKLVASLPAEHRLDEVLVRQRFYLDSIWWGQGEEMTPHLQTLHEAVWQDRQVRLSYCVGPVLMIDQLVDPYGLVAKAGIWYVVCAHQGRVRVHRVAQLVDAQLTTEPFLRPADFTLASFWADWCRDQETDASAYLVHLRVAPNLVAALPSFFGDRLRAQLSQAGPPDPDGWLPLTLAFESLEAARNRLLSLGGGVEVVRPLALRKSLLDFATQTVAVYHQERLG